MKRTDIAAINKALGTNFNPASRIIGMDADYVGGTAQTIANGGVLAMLTTFLDPRYIDTLVAPMRMAEIYKEVKKGDRTDNSVAIPQRELNGETSTYGDFNDNGVSGSNINWVFRQPYEYQTHVKIGEKEMEIGARANYDVVGSAIEGSILTLNKAQNQTYIYGVAGLQNYGVLNDPSLKPDIVGINWYTATAEQVYAEFQRLYNQLVSQAMGLVKARDAMTFTLSPTMEAHLHKTNQYGLNVYDLLTKNYPNLKIESVPEFSTPAGEKMQLVLDSYLGVDTIELAFPSKLHAHAVEQKTSGWLQKRSQSTLGAIIYRPVFVAGMLAQNTITP